jgi:hypothetical protein
MNNTMGAQTPEGRVYDAIDIAAQNAHAARLNEVDRELIALYRHLPECDQQAVLAQVRSWVDLHKRLRSKPAKKRRKRA